MAMPILAIRYEWDCYLKIYLKIAKNERYTPNPPFQHCMGGISFSSRGFPSSTEVSVASDSWLLCDLLRHLWDLNLTWICRISRINSPCFYMFIQGVNFSKATSLCISIYVILNFDGKTHAIAGPTTCKLSGCQVGILIPGSPPHRWRFNTRWLSISRWKMSAQLSVVVLELLLAYP